MVLFFQVQVRQDPVSVKNTEKQSYLTHYTMAPSLTETVALRAPTFSVPFKTDAGHNKENLIGYKYEKEAELKGTDKLPPASFPNYLPVWDNETER